MAEEMGFVGEQGRYGKKTLAEEQKVGQLDSFLNGQRGKNLNGKAEELRLVVAIHVRLLL